VVALEDLQGAPAKVGVLSHLRKVLALRAPTGASWHSWEVAENQFVGPVAEQYDADSSDMFDPAVIDPAVDLLADLARGGRALEFAVGTGRIALPLSRRGVEVHGIDLSADMVAQLQAKPGSEGVAVTIGDFATAVVDGRFSLVYLVYNTIGNLTTQDAQVQCFRNAARHLEPGGVFVIEVEVPQLQRLPPGETVRVFTSSPTRLGYDELDIATQAGVSHHHWMVDGRWETFSVPYRYVWPSELDLMARLAGLTLRERWGDWRRAPFTSRSTQHVSVWEKPA
jgi:SAM-dependent methyltransferase